MNTDTKWEAAEPAGIARGDKVKLAHTNGSVIYGVAVYGGGDRVAVNFDGGNERHFFGREGWTFERAVPERTLPTEPGIYADHYPSTGYTLFSLHDAGHWAHDGGGSKWQRIEDENDLPDDLVRLVPVTEVEELRTRIERAKRMLTPGKWSTTSDVIDALDGQATDA